MRKLNIVLILLIVIIVYMFNYISYSNHLTAYATDSTEAIHFDDVPQMFDAIVNLDYNAFLSVYYPPLYAFGTALLIIIFGKNWLLVNLLNNTFYLFIMLFFLFLIGKKLKDEKTGLIMAILVSLYPLTYSSYQRYLIDFSLMGFMTMSVYFYLQSESFSKRKWSILFGIGAGLGMMSKIQFAMFIPGPIIIGLFEVFKDLRIKKYNSLINFIIFLMTIIVVTSPYYCFKISIYYNDIINHTSTNRNLFLNLNSNNFYTSGLIEYQLTPFFFIVFIFGLYFFIKETNNNVKMTTILWILVPNIVLFFLVTNKSPRYVLPQLPAIAIISSFGIRKIIEKTAGKIVFILILIIGIIQYYDFTYGIGLNLDKKKIGKIHYHNYHGDIDMKANSKHRKEYIAFQNNINKIFTNLSDIMGKDEYNIVLLINNLDINFSLQDSMRGYLWFNNIPFKIYYIYTIFPNIDYDKYKNFDFIVYVKDDIEIKNPEYFNKTFYKMNLTYQKNTNYLQYRKKWDDLVAKFNKVGIIGTVKQDGKSYDMCLYVNKKLNMYEAKLATLTTNIAE